MSKEQKIALVQGRIVWIHGDLFTGALETIFGTQSPKINPKTGIQNTVFRFGLAVSKAELADPTRGAIWAKMHEEVRELYPSGQIPPAFAWKYKDGDGQGTDERGAVIDYSKKEGYAGCLVFTMSTNIAPRFFRWENGQNIQISDGIKCGDYVNVQVSIGSQMSQKPGLYLNPLAVQLTQPGKEIINAPSGDQVFGAGAPPMPANYVPPAQPVMPQVGAMPSPQAIAMVPQAPPPQQPAPHHAVLPQQFQPQAVPMYPPQPHAVAPPPGTPVGMAGYPQPGNGYPQQAMPPAYPAPTYPAPAAAPTPMVPPTAPSYAAGANPQYPQQPGMPPVPQ